MIGMNNNRKLRQAADALADALAASTALDRAIEFRQTLPALLLHLMARCEMFADCRVKARDSDWRVEFRFLNGLDNVSIGPETEEWEYEQLVNTVEGREAEARVEAERLKMAREVFDSLSPEQRLAIGLKQRP